MRFRFISPSHEALYVSGGKGETKFSPDTVTQFMKLMQIIRTARDERDLRAFKGRRFEKLQGNLSGWSSMRLNGQFRLIFTIEGEEMLIKGIEDYH